MYLHPDTNLLDGVTERQTIPIFLQHFLIDGYTPRLLQAKSFYLLTQHYEHPELDIYIHHIKTNKKVRLITKAATDRLLLAFINKNSISVHFYNGNILQVPAQSVLVFKLLAGKEIHTELDSAQYEMISCCLKPSFEITLKVYYPVLLNFLTQEMQHVTLLNQHPVYWVRYQWLELLRSFEPASLYPSFVAEKIRILLRYFVTELLAEEKRKKIHLLHPEVPIKVVEKAYEAREIIDINLCDTLSLVDLVKKTQWNLQGLKAGFVQVFGISPHRYMIKQRMELALKLVQQTDQPVRVIALLAGYKQAHHFIHQFKLAYGITPGEMRKENK